MRPSSCQLARPVRKLPQEVLRLGSELGSISCSPIFRYQFGAKYLTSISDRRSITDCFSGSCSATTPAQPLSVDSSTIVMEIHHEDLDSYLHVAVEAAKKAGQVILNSFYDTKAVEHKGKYINLKSQVPMFPRSHGQRISGSAELLCRVDLVTETDKACEDLIFKQLKSAFPSHELIGEEISAADGIPQLTNAATWIVDPLDGTTNFVHRYPFVCVSIGLVINKVPTVGVVYNPILEELFTAVQGKGAFLNGKHIYASDQHDIGNALLATEVGTNRNKQNVDITTNRINNLLFEVRSLRMCGSCAMNLCGIACGRLDLFYELGFGGPWDVAGGVLILQEAGGIVFDPSGGEFNIMSHRVAASNGHLKQALVNGLKGLV